MGNGRIVEPVAPTQSAPDDGGTGAVAQLASEYADFFSRTLSRVTVPQTDEVLLMLVVND